MNVLNTLTKALCICVMGLTLQACAANIQKYGEIDKNNKTITVPAGSKGLKGEIKKALAEDGWSMSVYRGPDVTEGTMGGETKLESYNTYNTRYTLAMASNVYDVCLNFSPAVSYDISLIDNKTGTEIITMDGEGCENGIAQEFLQALNGQAQ